MSTPIKIVDGRGSKNFAKVTTIGQLITAPFAYDEVSHVELDVINTAYNFFTPKTSEQFVITSFYAKADKGVSSVTEADFIIYESLSASSTTVDKVLFQTAMLQYDQVTMTGINILVNEGRWINAKTTDDDVHVTIMGYYIPKL